MQILFLLELLPINFSLQWGSWLQCSDYYCDLVKEILYSPHFFYIYQLEFFWKDKLYIHPHLFTELFIPSTHGYLFYSLVNNPILLLYMLLFKLFRLWPSGALSGWPLCSLRCPHLFYFPCPSPGVNHFCEELIGSFYHCSNQANFLRACPIS